MATSSIPITTPDQTQAIVKVNPAMMEQTQQPASDDATPSAPVKGSAEQRLAQAGIDKSMQDALLDVRRRCIDANAPKRQVYLERFNRALNCFKNNPYVLYDQQQGSFDTLNEVMATIPSDGKDLDLYAYNDNVYQMLGLTFVAALSVDLAKTRFQPTDADNEEDIYIASKASTIRAYNERLNKAKALQRKELLWLWVGGVYFAYVRNIVDANRAGTTKQPIKAMVPQQIAPDRFICSNCGQAAPAASVDPQNLNCPDCNQSLSQADWHEGVTGLVPQKIADVEIPNAMAAEDIYSGANVDMDCDAEEIYDSDYLDFSMEINLGPIRKAYPDAYKQIVGGQISAPSGAADQAAMIRNQVTTPDGQMGTTSNAVRGTYSRCWLQPTAFDVLEDQAMADALTQQFPDGVKLVIWGDNLLLDAIPDRMTKRWTVCRSIKGLGMYPFGVGDAALDIQKRINDVANSIHAYLDRLAFGTVVVDGDYLDVDQLERKPMTPGNMTAVYRSQNEGRNAKLDEMMWQPEFHIDAKIWEYGPQLVQLAQTLAGVQPQTFGGSDPNVKTMGGQAQALKTAMGRMAIFLDQMREEHAERSVNSVSCTVENMDELMKITEQGSVDSNSSTLTLLRSQLQGNFDYAESDEGFPSSYEEIQDRLMTLLTSKSAIPAFATLLQDPDNQEVVARYLLPDVIKVTGFAERARLKLLINELAKGAPQVQPNPASGQPMNVPSILPDGDIEDWAMATTLTKTWMQQNWQTANTPGYENVRAFLKMCAFNAQQQAIKQQMMQQQAEQQGGGGQTQQQQ